MEDWYTIRQSDFRRYGGSNILKHYNESPSLAVQSAYPEHKWVTFLFSNVPQSYWKDSSNHRSYMDWLGDQLGYKCLDDWYKVTQDDFLRNGGMGLITGYYNGSPSQVLHAVYPTHPWQMRRFTRIPRGYWIGGNKLQQTMDWLGNQLSIKSMDDWYNVHTRDISSKEGTSVLLMQYNNSVSRMLQAAYPAHPWQLWRFKKVPKDYWTNVKNNETELKQVLEWVGNQLSIKELDDWYRVSLPQIRKWVQVESGKQLGEVLAKAYPQHVWNLSLFGRLDVKASQRLLVVAVQYLFPNHSK